MDYLLELSRIVDGALKGDKSKVAAYVEQLIRKLKESGDPEAAFRLQKSVLGVSKSEVTPAYASKGFQIPVDNESRFSLADEELVSIESCPLVLDDAIQAQVREFISYINHADKLLANKVGIAPTMLISGPPGVGKTELARFIAASLQLPLLTTRSDSLISSFLGSTSKNIRSLFEHAQSRPCILFLDEFDSLAKMRDDQHELGELKRVVVSLLQNIDSLKDQTVLLAATNHAHLLDPAVWRRFNCRLALPLPNQKSRTAMFAKFLGEFCASSADAEDSATLSNGLSGADIARVCYNSIRAALVEDQSQVSFLDLAKSIIQQKTGEPLDFSSTDPKSVKAVYDMDPRIFTIKRLSMLFGISEATISRRLSQGSI